MKKLRLRRWILPILIVLILAYFALPWVGLVTVDLPKYRAAGDIVLLDQGWKPEQRTAFHHTAQGTRILPLKWFMALQQPCLMPGGLGCGMFADKEYLGRFGFIQSATDAHYNPYGLPVGFAIDPGFKDPLTGDSYPVVGVNCAACHTAELHYQNHAVRVEGGPAMINLDQFLKANLLAMAFTKTDPIRYWRFERRVLGPDASADSKVALKRVFNAFMDQGGTQQSEADKHRIYTNPEGFARTDALARIGNIVFAVDMNNWNNLASTSAPTRFPQIWDASWFTWVQYNASISNPMARNVGEAMGVQALTKLYGNAADKMIGSVNYQGVWDLEKLLSGSAPFSGLQSPKWPSAVFGALDQKKMDRGKELYVTHCVRCHMPPLDDLKKNFKDAQFWELRPEAPGQPATMPFLKCREIPLNVIGTDSNQAIDFLNRTADSGDLKKGILTAAEGLDYLTKNMAIKFYDAQPGAYGKGFSAATRWEWSGYQDPNTVGIRATMVYRPRPLNGIWAAAPYLHNGAVPTLDELLSPHEKRRDAFYLGSRDYDPVKVGYVVDELDGASRFDTTVSGNSNWGHEFANEKRPGVIGPLLPDADRLALIEYLKSL